jgi:hypothetical protein
MNAEMQSSNEAILIVTVALYSMNSEPLMEEELTVDEVTASSLRAILSRQLGLDESCPPVSMGSTFRIRIIPVKQSN